MIFFNIIQNQGIISYIFPHFGLKAQPTRKEEVYTSSFFVSAIPRKAPKTAEFVFYSDGRVLTSFFPIFC
nr:MAG TPA: hypothetical protein [Caudoviricetes sp.]